MRQILNGYRLAYQYGGHRLARIVGTLFACRGYFFMRGGFSSRSRFLADESELF
jgi:hypothetical protein